MSKQENLLPPQSFSFLQKQPSGREVSVTNATIFPALLWLPRENFKLKNPQLIDKSPSTCESILNSKGLTRGIHSATRRETARRRDCGWLVDSSSCWACRRGFWPWFCRFQTHGGHTFVGGRTAWVSDRCGGRIGLRNSLAKFGGQVGNGNAAIVRTLSSSGGGTSERAYDVQLHIADIRAYRRVGKCFPNLHGDVDMFLSKGETEYLLASTLHLSFSTGIIFGQSI